MRRKRYLAILAIMIVTAAASSHPHKMDRKSTKLTPTSGVTTELQRSVTEACKEGPVATPSEVNTVQASEEELEEPEEPETTDAEQTTVTSTEPQIEEPSTPDPNDTWIPEDEQEYCRQAGETFGISPELLMAIIESESSGQQYAKNGNCIGLMQINQYYHTGRMYRLGFVNLWDERANIYTGADLLRELLDKYGDTGTALMAYNGVRDASNRTSLTEYAEKILLRTEELERIHGK